MTTNSPGATAVNAPPSGNCTGAGGRIGTKYTYAQLEGLWINAGGSTADAPIMAAIAMAESAGCSAAFNPSGASGLWQVECPVNSQYIPGGCGNAFNAQDNAKAAVAIRKAQGLTAWSTYTNGAYKAFVNNGTTPAGINSTGSTTSSTGGGNTDTCIGGIPSIGLGPISTPGLCFFSKTNARALIGGLTIAAGGSILVVGLSVLTVGAFASTKAGKAAGKVVGTAGEAAGVAAAVAGFPEVGAVVGGASSKVKGRTGSGTRYARQKRSQSRTATAKKTSDDNAQARNDESQYKKVAARKSDSSKGKALRDNERAETGQQRANRMAHPPKSTRRERESVPF